MTKMSTNQQRQQLQDAVSVALTLAQKHSDAAEVAVTKSTGISVSTRFGEVENIEFNSDGALGITVYQGFKKGSASTSDLSPAAIESAVRSAIDIARYTSDDKASGLGDKALMAFEAPDLDLYHPMDLTPEFAIEQAALAETTALKADSRITESDGGSYSGHESIRVYGNTHGLLNSYMTTRYGMSCCVIAEENDAMVRDYAYTVARDARDLQSAEWVGQDCARRTVASLGARRLPTMTAPVMFVADVATGLFGHLVGAISGRSIYQKSSFLLDQLGKVILPENITIQERPHILKGLASTPFDSEGIRTWDQDIISQGVLTTYLLTSYTARKLGMSSTGHAGGIHNWRIAGQGRDFAAMLKLMDKGLLVTELMGQGVNGVTGDYSRGAAGFWVENGEIQYPVNEITIAGNLKEMYKNIVAVGDDIETRSNIQCGSVLIESMKIAGE